MGPSAIRYAGLRAGIESCGFEVFDLGNLPLMLGDDVDVGSTRAKYLDQIVHMAGDITEAVEGVLERGRFPLVLGGDHSASLGSVSGAALGRDIELIWVDAHGDFNTPETTPSGNVHGMVLAALAGYGDPRMVEFAARAQRCGLLPSRWSEWRAYPGERDLLRSSAVHVFTMFEINQRACTT